MIEVSHLTKRFPGHVAVDDVSFQVNPGEIVGFLGPNGAGKTTTMRILSGYLPATGGVVRVGGHDVFKESLKVRSRIGYLPENCPLYPEMRVDEYLAFRARLKGVHRRFCKRRVEQVKELCDLQEYGRKIIGKLSKGYRQRVGLAESLVHEPDLLILDEPTIGLDPNQIRQVRALIKDLAKRHTILLSTHILPEVEMICERVLIINKGRIVASDTPANLGSLMRGSSRVVAEISGAHEHISAELAKLSGVERVAVSDVNSWSQFELHCAQDVDPRADIFELAVKNQWKIRELRLERKTLEDAFVALTDEGEGVSG